MLVLLRRLAAILSKRDGELACDAGTLKLLGEDSRFAYGRTLIQMMALKNSPSSLLSLTTTMSASKSVTRERIMMIAKKNRMYLTSLVLLLCILLITVGCTFTGEQDKNPKNLKNSRETASALNTDSPSNTGTTSTAANAAQTAANFKKDLQEMEILDSSEPAGKPAEPDCTDLEACISNAILKENASSYQKGVFKTESHIVLGKDESAGKITIYAMVLYQEYGYEAGKFKDLAGIHCPASLTFSINKKGEYTLTEYWIPEDGSYYAPSIKEKFPAVLYQDAIDTQKYIREQQAECDEKADQYLNTHRNKTTIKNFQYKGSTNLADIKKMLSSYPAVITKDAGVNYGFLVIVQEKIYGGKNVWNNFYKYTQDQTPSSLIILQYTEEGDPILTYLAFNKDGYYAVEDDSRDKYRGEVEVYSEHSYQYLNIYNVTYPSNQKYKEYVLLDDNTRTQKELQESVLSSRLNAWIPHYNLFNIKQ